MHSFCKSIFNFDVALITTSEQTPLFLGTSFRIGHGFISWIIDNIGFYNGYAAFESRVSNNRFVSLGC
jgi:hypothetical protein